MNETQANDMCRMILETVKDYRVMICIDQDKKFKIFIFLTKQIS